MNMAQSVVARHARWSAVLLLVLSAMAGTPRAWAQKPQAMEAHTGEVSAIAFSSDGKLLATGGADTLVKVWDVATRKELRTLRGHTSGINAVAFTADGKTLASAGPDKTIKLWNPVTGEERATLKDHTGSIWSLAITSDGKTLASGGNDMVVRLWDVPRGELAAKLTGPTETVESVAFSPNGETLVTSEGLAGVRVWDVATRKERNRPNIAVLGPVAFTADGKLLAIPIGDHLAFVDLGTGKVQSTLKMPAAPHCYAVALSRDGKWAAASTGRPQQGSLTLWQIGIAEPRASLGYTALQMAFSPDGSTLAVATASGEVLWWRLPQPR
jgi:WD40 repeat protein